jgi:hypothetical protein
MLRVDEGELAGVAAVRAWLERVDEVAARPTIAHLPDGAGGARSHVDHLLYECWELRPAPAALQPVRVRRPHRTVLSR